MCTQVWVGVCVWLLAVWCCPAGINWGGWGLMRGSCWWTWCSLLVSVFLVIMVSLVFASPFAHDYVSLRHILAGGRRCKRTTWTEFLFRQKKKEILFFFFLRKIEILLTSKQRCSRLQRITSILIGLLVWINVSDLHVCGTLASQENLNCGTCCRSRWVYVDQAARTMITFVENPQTRDNLFFIVRSVHRQSYIPHNNITKGPCKHVTLLHTLTHCLTLYLLNEELSVCVSYTPVSPAWLHNSVMNNSTNTGQLSKLIIYQGHDYSDLESVNMQLEFAFFILQYSELLPWYWTFDRCFSPDHLWDVSQMESTCGSHEHRDKSSCLPGWTENLPAWINACYHQRFLRRTAEPDLQKDSARSLRRWSMRHKLVRSRPAGSCWKCVRDFGALLVCLFAAVPLLKGEQ